MPVGDFDAWRSQARELLGEGISPEQVRFLDVERAQPLLDAQAPPNCGIPKPTGKVPREFLTSAALVACFRDQTRWDLLYRMLYRMTHGESHLLEIDIDDDVRRFRLMERAVRRDMHKMTAFVRFREMLSDGVRHYVAWHRPDHQIVAATAPFFVRRFGAMRWAILTPDRSAYWDGTDLRFGPGLPRSAAPGDDGLEDLWRAYYASIFNPARVNIRAMRAEMPVRHWPTLPEAQIISELLRNADSRVVAMIDKQPPSAKDWIPQNPTLPKLISASRSCKGCELFQHATQTVFGEGPENASVVIVGEQPGDREDLAGKTFVGPAGQMLNRALAEAGVDRNTLYVTNAVKHFKFTERGKRRIHAKPNGLEISACRPWLEAELAILQPQLVVCLGATAALALMGRDFQVTRDRGTFFPHRWAGQLMATIHPSFLLRMPERDRAEEEYRLFVRDLSLIRPYLARAARFVDR